MFNPQNDITSPDRQTQSNEPESPPDMAVQLGKEDGATVLMLGLLLQCSLR